MPPLRLRIGDWWVDPGANELGRDGESARIEPKAMQVLAVLARHAGRVVGRDELLSEVWPGVVVGDEALTQTIIKLRKALGDSPRSPSYIETISKRGYRLVAPVRPFETLDPAADRSPDLPIPSARVSVETADPPANPPPASSPNVPAKTGRRAYGAGLAAGLAIAVAAGGYALHSHRKPDPGIGVIEAVDPQQPAPVTVTVMPFESLGAHAEQTYLAQGISNDLMTDLSRLAGLRVISHSSGPPARSASRARYLVHGSVQRESGTLRINIRLVDAGSGQQLWSERFERPVSDLFAIQDEIVRRLTELLPGKLTDAARRELAGRHTRNLEAYDWFLRAQALLLARQAAVNEEARALYRKALELDPKFARAYAGLAMTYAMDYRLRPSEASSSTLARAFELAESARLIDPGIPEVYWALGFVHVQSRRLAQAMEALQKAIALNPSYADAYAFMGGIHNYLGESEKAIPLVRTALRLNPDGSYLYFMILGRAYFYENDLEQAIINLREAESRNPADIETRIHLAAARIAAGDRAAAEWEAAEIRSLVPGFSTRAWLQTYPMVSSEYRKRLTVLLAEVGL